MFRTQFLLLASTWGVLTASAAAVRGDEPATDQAAGEAAPPAAPGELPPHLRAVQRNMGGSVVRQFDPLRLDAAAAAPWWKQFEQTPQATATDSPAWPTANAPAGDAASAAPGTWLNWASTPAPTIVPATVHAPTHLVPPAIAALRATAAELDVAANRLEEMELYRQSDSLREVAQRLRIDARRLTTSGGAAFDAPPLLAPRETAHAMGPSDRPSGILPAEPTPAEPELFPDPTPIPSHAEPEPASPSATIPPTPDIWNPPATEAPADRAN